MIAIEAVSNVQPSDTLDLCEKPRRSITSSTLGAYVEYNYVFLSLLFVGFVWNGTFRI